MRRVSLLVAMLLSATVVHAETYFADRIGTETLWHLAPAERIERMKTLYPKMPWYPERIEFFLRDNARTAHGVDMVFLGDSLSECFPVDEAFNAMTDDDPSTRTLAVNRGISGDFVESIIARLDISIRDLQPKTVYFLAGGNDIWSIQDDYKDGNLIEGYRRIVHRIRELSPNSEIIMQTCTPMNMYAYTHERWEEFRPQVARAAAQLRQVAAEKNLQVIELGKALADERGNIIPRYTIDGIHLTLLGYLRWIDEIVPASPEKMRVWRNLALKFLREVTTTHTIDGFNIPREEDTMIVYTRDGGTTSTGQTKGWGVEVQVVDDTVTSITRKGDMPIPENGIVISGLKSTGDWIQNNANLGVRLAMEGNKIVTEPKRTSTPDEIYEAARAELMRAFVGLEVIPHDCSERMEQARRGDVLVAQELLKELRELNKSANCKIPK